VRGAHDHNASDVSLFSFFQGFFLSEFATKSEFARGA
jgi:hypothetical protein